MTEGTLAKPAHKMTTDELLTTLLSTFQLAIDPASPLSVRNGAIGGNREIVAELAKRIDRD